MSDDFESRAQAEADKHLGKGPFHFDIDDYAYTFIKGANWARAEMQGEIDRLKRIIAKELSENDELGCEYTYVNTLRAENDRLKAELNAYEHETAEAFIKLTEERDTLRAQLKLARDILLEASETIHGEFCGHQHHRLCILSRIAALDSQGDGGE